MLKPHCTGPTLRLVESLRVVVLHRAVGASARAQTLQCSGQEQNRDAGYRAQWPISDVPMPAERQNFGNRSEIVGCQMRRPIVLSCPRSRRKADCWGICSWHPKPDRLWAQIAMWVFLKLRTEDNLTFTKAIEQRSPSGNE